MEHFVIIIKGFQSLTIITKRSILDVAAALDPSLHISYGNEINAYFLYNFYFIQLFKINLYAH